MTRDEALEAMKQGNKVTHTSFDSLDYLYMDENRTIRDENNYNFTDGWELRKGTLHGYNWDIGWEIYN